MPNRRQAIILNSDGLVCWRTYALFGLGELRVAKWSRSCMMTSSNGNIFRVTGHLCWEFTGLRWIPRTKEVTRSFDVFFDLRPNKRLSKQLWGWWFETHSPHYEVTVMFDSIRYLMMVYHRAVLGHQQAKYVPISNLVYMTGICTI